MEAYYSWHDIELAIRARERGKPYDSGAIEYARRRIGRDITQDVDGGFDALQYQRDLDNQPREISNGREFQKSR